MQQGVVRAYVAAKRAFVPVAGTDENGFACQLEKYKSQGLQGVQVGSALYAYALGLKTTLQVLEGKDGAEVDPGLAGRSGARHPCEQVRPEARAGPVPRRREPHAGHQPDAREVLKYMK